jgi:hypothetical protein
MGNNNEVFQITDGSIWQVKYEYEYLYEYSPEVVVCPGDGKLIIKGKKLNIAKISGGPSAASVGKHSPTKQRPTPESSRVIESQIDGDFNGWEGGTIYKLLNGQVWQQLDAHYHYHYAYSPKVLVYPTNGGLKMHVEGDNDQDVSVQLLN